MVMEEKRYDVCAVKDRLVRYMENEREIDNQIERLEHLNARMIGLGAQVLTDMPKAPSAADDRLASLLSQKDELEALIRGSVSEVSRERNELESILQHIRNPDERAVIRMRYFDRSSWLGVRDMLFGNRPDFEGKEDTYLRRAHRVHDTALLNMAKYIEETADQKAAVSANQS